MSGKYIQKFIMVKLVVTVAVIYAGFGAMFGVSCVIVRKRQN